MSRLAKPHTLSLPVLIFYQFIFLSFFFTFRSTTITLLNYHLLSSMLFVSCPTIPKQVSFLCTVEKNTFIKELEA